MSDHVSLRGSCACGRNRYIVEIPQTSSHAAQVIFDNSALSRWHLASPFAAWLRIPLEWYHSTTYALFPDETHRSIRRTFVSPFASDTKRQFCGYCGTPLSAWHERTREDADFISVTLGSLVDEDLGLLEDLGLMADTSSGEEEQSNQSEMVTQGRPRRQISYQRPGAELMHRGAPWFEDMIEDSRLGRLSRRKGGHTSRDGTVRVEWEVVEWESGNDASGGEGGPGKRKVEDMEGDNAEPGDVTMKNV